MPDSRTSALEYSRRSGTTAQAAHLAVVGRRIFLFFACLSLLWCFKTGSHFERHEEGGAFQELEPDTPGDEAAGYLLPDGAIARLGSARLRIGHNAAPGRALLFPSKPSTNSRSKPTPARMPAATRAERCRW